MRKLMSCGFNLIIVGLFFCAISCCLLTGGTVKAGDPPVAQVVYLPPVAQVDSTPVRVPLPPVAVVAEKPVVPTPQIRKNVTPISITPIASSPANYAVPRPTNVPTNYYPNYGVSNNYYPKEVSRPANPFLIPTTHAIGVGQVNTQLPGSIGMGRIPTFVIGAGTRGDTNCSSSG